MAKARQKRQRMAKARQKRQRMADIEVLEASIDAADAKCDAMESRKLYLEGFRLGVSDQPKWKLEGDEAPAVKAGFEYGRQCLVRGSERATMWSDGLSVGV